MVGMVWGSSANVAKATTTKTKNRNKNKIEMKPEQQIREDEAKNL